MRAFRVYPPIEIRQAAPCRAIRGQHYLSQQYYPPSETMYIEHVYVDVYELISGHITATWITRNAIIKPTVVV